MAHLKTISHSISIEKVIRKANYLYEKYRNTDFVDWAERNRKALDE